MSTIDPPTPPGAPPEGDDGGKIKRLRPAGAPKRKHRGRPPFRAGLGRMGVTKFCGELAQAIVDAVTECCSIRSTAGELGISTKAVHTWIDQNLPYQVLVDEIDEQGQPTGQKKTITRRFGDEMRKAQHRPEQDLTRRWSRIAKTTDTDWRSIQALLQVVNRERFGPPEREDRSAPVLVPASPVGESDGGPVIRFFLPQLIFDAAPAALANAAKDTDPTPAEEPIEADPPAIPSAAKGPAPAAPVPPPAPTPAAGAAPPGVKLPPWVRKP